MLGFLKFVQLAKNANSVKGPKDKRTEDKLDRLIGQVNVFIDAVGKFEP